METEVQQQMQKEIADLKLAMHGVANALRQLQWYAQGIQPTQEGLKLLDDYVNQVDKVVNPGGIRGLGTP
jgi:hypothetical protein